MRHFEILFSLSLNLSQCFHFHLQCYTGCLGWGGQEDFFGVMYYIGEINTGVPPGLGVPSIWGVGGLYKSLICHISMGREESLYLVVILSSY